MPRELPQDQWIQSAVLQFEAPLIVYAARILGDSDRARDVVQETFLRLCGQDQREVEPHLLEWLYLVCRNRALDLLRRQKTRQAADLPPSVACRIAAPSKQIEDRDLAARIIGMLDELPENQRAVLVLVRFEGMSYRQTSEVLGITEGAVESRLVRAMRRLEAAQEAEGSGVSSRERMR